MTEISSIQCCNTIYLFQSALWFHRTFPILVWVTILFFSLISEILIQSEHIRMHQKLNKTSIKEDWFLNSNKKKLWKKTSFCKKKILERKMCFEKAFSYKSTKKKMCRNLYGMEIKSLQGTQTTFINDDRIHSNLYETQSVLVPMDDFFSKSFSLLIFLFKRKTLFNWSDEKTN